MDRRNNEAIQARRFARLGEADEGNPHCSSFDRPPFVAPCLKYRARFGDRLQHLAVGAAANGVGGDEADALRAARRWSVMRLCRIRVVIASVGGSDPVMKGRAKRPSTAASPRPRGCQLAARKPRVADKSPILGIQ